MHRSMMRVRMISLMVCRKVANWRMSRLNGGNCFFSFGMDEEVVLLVSVVWNESSMSASAHSLT